MCRLYGFRSSVLSGVHSSLIAAENALVRQSAWHPDGWGVSYYNGRFPHLIRNDKQALADGLFKEVSAVVATRTLIAHIRQATAGEVSVLNCHPFQHGPWTFAHNGSIAGFAEHDEPRLLLREKVDPRFLPHILGSTDSEVCFYLFLSMLSRRVEDIFHEGISAQIVADALQETIDVILETAIEHDPEDPNRTTFMVTNGSAFVAIRNKRSLYYSTYKTKCPESSTCHAYDKLRCEQEVQQGIVKHLIVTSERIADNPNVWVELMDGEYVMVNYGMVFTKGRASSLYTGSNAFTPSYDNSISPEH